MPGHLVKHFDNLFDVEPKLSRFRAFRRNDQLKPWDADKYLSSLRIRAKVGSIDMGESRADRMGAMIAKALTRNKFRGLSHHAVAFQNQNGTVVVRNHPLSMADSHHHIAVVVDGNKVDKAMGFVRRRVIRIELVNQAVQGNM